MTRLKDYIALAVFALLSLVFAAAGGAVTATSVDSWYPELAKPWFNPPAWVFAPVWTVLFALMALAAWWVWQREPSESRRAALILHLVQLVLNLAWTVLFFGLQAIAAAFFQVLVVWLAVAAMIERYSRVDRLAALISLPYLAWLTFAALLNAVLWAMNGP